MITTYKLNCTKSFSILLSGSVSFLLITCLINCLMPKFLYADEKKENSTAVEYANERIEKWKKSLSESKELRETIDSYPIFPSFEDSIRSIINEKGKELKKNDVDVVRERFNDQLLKNRLKRRKDLEGNNLILFEKIHISERNNKQKIRNIIVNYGGKLIREEKSGVNNIDIFDATKFFPTLPFLSIEYLKLDNDEYLYKLTYEKSRNRVLDNNDKIAEDILSLIDNLRDKYGWSFSFKTLIKDKLKSDADEYKKLFDNSEEIYKDIAAYCWVRDNGKSQIKFKYRDRFGKFDSAYIQLQYVNVEMKQNELINIENKKNSEIERQNQKNEKSKIAY